MIGLLWWACGCGPAEPQGTEPVPEPEPEPEPTHGPPTPEPDPVPALSWAEHIPTVVTVSWPAPAGTTRSRVEYGLGEPLDLQTPWVEGPAPAIPLFGLKAGRTYRWRAVSEGAGRWEGPTSELLVPEAPETLPALRVEREPGSVVAGGFVLVSTLFDTPFSDPFVAIYDGDGDPVWWWAHPAGRFTVSPSVGATPGTLLWDRYDHRGAAVAQQVRLDGVSGVEVPLLDGHHAVIEPEPGTLAWIARDLRPNPNGEGWVTADRLFEAPIAQPDARREVVALYDALFGGAFTPPCEHAEAPQTLGETSPLYEWTHLNSLAWIPSLDAYLLNARWLDAILLIDRPTGAIRWQLGGPGGDFVLPGGGDPYGSAEESFVSHLHLSEAWDGGLVAFDNGTHHTPAVSSVVELAWDEDARTVEEVFRWEDPTGRYANVLGDVRRLPGGGYLVSWSTLGEITEIGADGVVRWTATAGPLDVPARVVFLPDLYEIGMK